MEIIFVCNWICNHQVTTIFCTCHDSCAVVTCAKFYGDYYNTIWTGEHHNLPKTIIMGEIFLVRWVLASEMDGSKRAVIPSVWLTAEAPGGQFNLQRLVSESACGHWASCTINSLAPKQVWCCQSHDDVMIWKDFLHYWPFVRGIYWSSMNSPNKWPVTQSFDVFFVGLNNLLNKLSKLHVIGVSIMWHTYSYN